MPVRTDTLEIQHQGDTVIYRVADVECEMNDGRFNLTLETIADGDGPFSHLSNPTLHIEDAVLQVHSMSEIENEQIDVKIGWDTDEHQKSDNIFRVNINQHLALNNNRLTIRRLSKSEVSIEWKCTCQNILDFRDADNELELVCVVNG